MDAPELPYSCHATPQSWDLRLPNYTSTTCTNGSDSLGKSYRTKTPVHIPLWLITRKGTRHQLESLIGSTSPDRRTLQKEKSVDRTILVPHHSQPTTLEQIPCHRHPRPQQFKEHINWLCTKQTPHQLGTPTHTRTNHIGQQPISRKNHRTIMPTPSPRHHSLEQPCKQ
jgi:hypothetical protein